MGTDSAQTPLAGFGRHSQALFSPQAADLLAVVAMAEAAAFFPRSPPPPPGPPFRERPQPSPQLDLIGGHPRWSETLG